MLVLLLNGRSWITQACVVVSFLGFLVFIVLAAFGYWDYRKSRKENRKASALSWLEELTEMETSIALLIIAAFVFLLFGPVILTIGLALWMGNILKQRGQVKKVN